MISTWAIGNGFLSASEGSLPVRELREILVVLSGTAVGCLIASIIFNVAAGLAGGGRDLFVWDGGSFALLARFVLTIAVVAMFLGVIGTAFVALEQVFLLEAGLSRRWSYGLAACSGAPLGAAMLLYGEWSATSAVLGATFGLCCACAWAALDLLIPLAPGRKRFA